MNREEELNLGHSPMGRAYMMPKKKNYWGDILKVGCGFVFGVCFTILCLFIIAASPWYQEYLENQEDRYLVKDNDSPTPLGAGVQSFHVKSKKGSGTIYIGMPKDSVLMLLGEPDGFVNNKYSDRIEYEFGDYNLNTLIIEFENRRVNSVTQY